MALSQEHEDNISRLIKDYKSWASSLEGAKDREIRDKKIKLFQGKFSKNKIDNLDAEEFKEILKDLWAMQIWGNKEWQANRIITENGFDKIRSNLKKLFYDDATIGKRFDAFRKEILHLGPAYVTELLLFFDPNEYCLWNEKPKSVLPYFKMDNLLPAAVFKYQISGSQYEQCIKVLNIIKELLAKQLGNADFLDVDYFLWYIFENVLPGVVTPTEKKEKPEKEELEEVKVADLQHGEDVQWVLLRLGNMLGFQTYTADPSKRFRNQSLSDVATLKELPEDYIPPIHLDTIKRIDVIWLTKENLPAYCFEVEHSTDITKGLLRLYQLITFQTKLFIVAPNESRQKFLTEIAKDPFRHHQSRYLFRPYNELIRLYNEALEYSKLKNSFL